MTSRVQPLTFTAALFIGETDVGTLVAGDMGPFPSEAAAEAAALTASDRRISDMLADGTITPAGLDEQYHDRETQYHSVSPVLPDASDPATTGAFASQSKVREILATASPTAALAIAALDYLVENDPTTAFAIYRALEAAIQTAEFPRLAYKPADDEGSTATFIDPHTGEPTELRAIGIDEQWDEVAASNDERVDPSTGSVSFFRADQSVACTTLAFTATVSDLPVRLPDGWGESDA